MDERARAEEAARRAALLLHDVGKYVARTARNLPERVEAPLGPGLLAMLVRDLYALGAGERASARLARLGAEPAALVRDERLAEARRLLAEVDALEARVRAGDPEAVTRVAAAARRVEQLLRALAQAMRSTA